MNGQLRKRLMDLLEDVIRTSLDNSSIQDEAKAVYTELLGFRSLVPWHFTTGMRVAYIPGHADGDINHKDVEQGFVSSNNAKNVFVKFDKQLNKFGWEGTTSQACSPEDLRMLP